jgi:hypothetical protein
VRVPILSFAQNQRNPLQRPRAICAKKQMLQSRTVSEIYSPTLEAAFKFILEDPTISSSVEKVSFQFITAARFLKNDAPHLFQVREMGAESENRMDRWLWDLLNWPGSVAEASG